MRRLSKNPKFRTNVTLSFSLGPIGGISLLPIHVSQAVPFPAVPLDLELILLVEFHRAKLREGSRPLAILVDVELHEADPVAGRLVKILPTWNRGSEHDMLAAILGGTNANDAHPDAGRIVGTNAAPVF